ncbi:MAG: hypothetical protein GY943_00755 [Chloroflexi bacterium]|nr:hypothetical protein [Chloroflexota bacterium]
MNKRNKKISNLVTDIFETQADEIQCDEAGNQMARAVYANLGDDGTRQTFARLWHHLKVCSNCAQEFSLLQEVVTAETAVSSTPPPQTPPVPDNGRFPRLSTLKNAISIQFPGFSAQLGHALTRGEEMLVAPTAVPFPHTPITLELDVAINETNPQQRDLFLTIIANEINLRNQLEGASIWLQLGDEGPITQEQTLDELGDTAFSNLRPGRYALRLTLAKQHFVVSNITLP